VRIDIVNSFFPKRVRDVIEVVGHAAFLLPLTVIMLITGLPFFLASFRINEQSANAGGLPQWPAKGLLLIGFAFLFAQGLSELIKRIAIMRGQLPDPEVKGAELHTSAAAEAASLAATTDEYKSQ
jgi:TRAP-type mannitol/chloroaromatic compound transport system permease small subunit